jgi:hypothetical protein
VARYAVNPASVARIEERIRARQYVLRSDWGEAQPSADDENAYLERHGWDDYASWFIALTDEASDETKARYAFVCGDFRRVHRSGLIAWVYGGAVGRHKSVERAPHDLLQLFDATSG